MDRRRVVGQIRVQEIFLGGGRRAWTILWLEGAVYEEADRFLRRCEGEPGTQRTYAYLLVDHRRWSSSILESRWRAADVRTPDPDLYADANVSLCGLVARKD